VADTRRLASLRATGLLDTPRDEAFDRLSGLAARLLDAPIALVTLVDEDRQFFKSCTGLPSPWAERRETPLSHSFCQHVVDRRRPLVLNDAREDPVLRDNLAVPEIGVVAYAGVPLTRPDGQVLGSLCAIDTKPRHWTPDQVQILSDLASSVVSEIELRAA
jgi:GAF domain-containing protein